MKILIVAPGNPAFSDFRNGSLLGIEHQIWGLARAFARRGHDVYIVRKWQKGGPPQESTVNVTLVNVPAPPSPDWWPGRLAADAIFSWRARKRIESLVPDRIILTEMVTSTFLAALPIPKVYVTHNRPSRVDTNWAPIKNFAKGIIEDRVFGRCIRVVALNSAILENLKRRRFPAFQIPNAVEQAECVEQKEEDYVLGAGRLEKIKGFRFLLEAYAGIAEELRRKFRLVIIGYGSQRKALLRLTTSLGISANVRFLDWQPHQEFIANLAACVVFVLPSISEVFPVTLIQAMACGKPVIASDIPGPSDVLRHGYNGMLFQARDTMRLRQLLEAALSDEGLRRRLGANARKTVESGLTFDETALMYENALSTSQEVPG